MGSITRDKVLISYNGADARWMERLRILLRDLDGPGVVEAREIDAAWGGAQWREEHKKIAKALARARVVVLLVSPEYLSSEFIARDELYRLLAQENGLQVVWVPIRPSNFAASPLCSYPALLALQHPLAELDETAAYLALLDVSRKIDRLLLRDNGLSTERFAETEGKFPRLRLTLGGTLGRRTPAATDRAEGARPRCPPDDAQRQRPGSTLAPGSALAGHRSSPRKEGVQPVHLGASAPRAVRPGQEFTARFSAYHPALAREVKRQLRKAGAKAKPHVGLATALWKDGTIVIVRVSGDSLEVSPPSQNFVWRGQQHFLDFDVRVQERAPDNDTRLKFDVCIDGLVLARLRLDLRIQRTWRFRSSWPARRSCAFAAAPRTAFASYASEDQPRALDRVAAIQIATGIDVFMDCLSLRPNAKWQASLESEIYARDVFMLFWSEWAARSSWVEWEWRCALQRKGLDAIQAHPLDPWPKAPLPQELSGLHMGDSLMAVREAALQEQKQPERPRP